MSEKEQLQQKQQYLRQEILEHNYDPEQFIVYLNQQLNINSDLDRCTLDQLKKVVAMFVKEKQSNIIQNVGSVNSSAVLLKDGKKNSIVYKQYSPSLVEDQYQIKHKCIKIISKISAQSIKHVKCQVKNPQRRYVGGILGIGATSFLQFEVQTHGVGWLVKRRYSDFVWLRLTLRKFFPSLIIPPIPEKKASKRTQRHVQKRMRILTGFLNDLIRIPQLFYSRYVQLFLSLEDNDKLQELKNQANSKVAYESISSTETSSGFVNIGLSDKKVGYAQELARFVQKNQVLYKQITRGSKRFQTHKVEQVNQLYQMGNRFAQLYQAGKRFQGVVKTQGISSLNQIFIKLNNMMIEWGNQIKNQIQLLEINFNTFFKYQRQSNMGFRQILDKNRQLQSAFLQQKFILQQKKQKIFLLHDANKWEIPKKDIAFIPKAAIYQRNQAFRMMLPKQSVELQKKKDLYAFYLSRLYDSSSLYFQGQVEKFNENFRQYAIKQKVNNQQMGVNWQQMCSIFSGQQSFYKKVKQMQKISQYGDKSKQQIIQ